MLHAELERRTRHNSNYSMRAFARDLGLTSSRLSEILSKKQGLSRKVAERIAETIGLPPGERTFFCDLVEAQHARSKAKRDMARKRCRRHSRDNARRLIGLDVFETISQWYHMAILELVTIDGFVADIDWIADALEIDRQMAAAAVDRLVRLNMLEWNNGFLVCLAPITSTPMDIPSAAIKSFHAQMLEKAKHALFARPILERDAASVIFSIKKTQLPELKELNLQFRRKIAQLADATPDRTSVYCLTSHLFELTAPEVGR